MNFFFCGIAGSGMSALAQITKSEGHKVYGSDRSFDQNKSLDIKEKLENLGIKVYPQDGSGVTKNIDFFVFSTAIEEENPDLKKAKELNLKIIHRSELLSEYVSKHKTIAVSGTSGKSTTTALIWHILYKSGLDPSIINGAYLNTLIEKGLIGNAYKGKGKILIIEADESDSSIKNYKPDIGVILNKSVEELKKIFLDFASNCNVIYANKDDRNTIDISKKIKNIKFFTKENIKIKRIESFFSEFYINNILFYIPLGGIHNIENSLAAIYVTKELGINIEDISKSISGFQGTFRRMNIILQTNDIIIIDDYAHNPAKIEATIKTLNISGKRIIIIYQPHGFAPTKLFKDELIDVFLRTKNDDIIIMPEIYYAGGTVKKDISSKDIIDILVKKGKKAFYFERREKIIEFILKITEKGDIIVIMGARDNTLHLFAKDIANKIKQYKLPIE